MRKDAGTSGWLGKLQNHAIRDNLRAFERHSHRLRFPHLTGVLRSRFPRTSTPTIDGLLCKLGIEHRTWFAVALRAKLDNICARVGI